MVATASAVEAERVRLWHKAHIDADAEHVRFWGKRTSLICCGRKKDDSVAS
jgi:hypothetical protein